MKRHTLILFLLCFSFSPLGFAQNQGLYFMKGMQQSLYLNPAFQDDCSFFLGFPGISSLQTGVQLKSFSASNFFELSSNPSPDLDRINSIDFQTDLTWFSIGFRNKKWGFTFDVSERIEGRADLAKDLILFMTQGNYPFIGQTADFSQTGLSLSYFRQYAFGYSRQILPFLTLGLRAKILRGQLALQTDYWNMSVYTAPESYDLTVQSDVRMLASAPISIGYKANDPEAVDDIDLVDKEGKDYLDDYLFNNNNKGLAFDIGIVAKPTEKLTFAASLTDLGSILWKQDVWDIRQDGEFQYNGIDFNPYTDTLGSDNYDPFRELTDSVAEEFKIQASPESFRTHLSPRWYMGATYDLRPNLSIGFLSTTWFSAEKTRQAFTLSANGRLKRWLSLSGNYSYFGYAPANLGLGMAISAGPLQFHFLTDNILGIRIDPDQHFPWPAYSRNLAFRFGINFRFGKPASAY